MSKQKGPGLLKYLDFQPEYREDGGKTPVVETGRFKYFWDVAKRRNGSILTANLLFIVTLLPLVAVFVLIAAFGGTEALAYKLKNIGTVPYLLSDIGFGLSSSVATVLGVKLYILDVYYWIFLAVGVSLVVMSVGLAGMVPLCMKFITGDVFLSKKDNYGNDVPRACREFFKGIKRCGAQMLVAGAIFFVLFAGIANVFVYFIGKYWSGTANAGHWIMVIFAAAVALFGFMYLIHLIPSIALYDMPLSSKMKNSAIFTVHFFVQNILILSVFSIPFIIIGVANTIIGVLMIAVLLVYGSKYYCLTICNYEQYISQNIIMPVVNASYAKSVKSKKNK
jgi:hypothetical protein